MDSKFWTEIDKIEDKINARISVPYERVQNVRNIRDFTFAFKMFRNTFEVKNKNNRSIRLGIIGAGPIT
jgi:hypothetical protein